MLGRQFIIVETKGKNPELIASFFGEPKGRYAYYLKPWRNNPMNFKERLFQEMNIQDQGKMNSSVPIKFNGYWLIWSIKR